jgi:hypothetical protein
MANLTVLLNAPAPVTFTIPLVSKLDLTQWTLSWDFVFGAKSQINFSPLGGWFSADAVVPFTINGSNSTTAIVGHQYPVPAAPHQEVPEGGSGGLAILAFGFVALASALVRRRLG